MVNLLCPSTWHCFDSNDAPWGRAAGDHWFRLLHHCSRLQLRTLPQVQDLEQTSNGKCAWETDETQIFGTQPQTWYRWFVQVGRVPMVPNHSRRCTARRWRVVNHLEEGWLKVYSWWRYIVIISSILIWKKGWYIIYSMEYMYVNICTYDIWYYDIIRFCIGIVQSGWSNHFEQAICW